MVTKITPIIKTNITPSVETQNTTTTTTKIYYLLFIVYYLLFKGRGNHVTNLIVNVCSKFFF